MLQTRISPAGAEVEVGAAHSLPQARVWAATNHDVTAYPWPEQAPSVGLVERTKNVGVAISGGGLRSYAAGFGQLRALRDLDVLSNVRYLCGVSGGGLVSAVFTYHQSGVSDHTLLGQTPQPSDLTLERLSDLPHSSLGWGATADITFNLGRELVNYIARGRTRAGDIWSEALANAFLDHYGLGSDKYFTLSASSRDEILERNEGNPDLNAGMFLLPAQLDRPYLLLPVIAVGPIPRKCIEMPSTQADPQKCGSYLAKLFRPMAATPLYTGYAADRGQSLFVELGNGERRQVHEGGLVESWAFGGEAPQDGRGAVQGGAQGQVRQLGIPAEPWSLKAAVGATSAFGTLDLYWYENGTRAGPKSSVRTGEPGADFLTQPIPSGQGWNYYDGAQFLAPAHKLWDTSDANPVTEDVFVTDGAAGGDYSGIIDIIARGVDHVISFFNTNDTLCGSDAWDPAQDMSAEKVKECAGSELAVLFGVDTGAPAYGAIDLSAAHSQVFPRASFIPFVQALQASQAAGKTAFARMTLTTVANEWRRIPAGREVDLALFYLSASNAWAAELPEETQQALEHSPDLQNFPDFVTVQSNPGLAIDWTRIIQRPPQNPLPPGLSTFNERQINLLASLTGWAVLQAADEIASMFS